MNQVYYAKINALYDRNIYLNYYHKLPMSRKRRVDNYAFEDDKIRSVAAFTLLIKLLNEHHIKYQDEDFKTDQNGKLFLNGIDVQFNLSHSGDYVVVGISDQAIGVDVQYIDKNKDIKKIINYVLDKDELKNFKKKDFYLTWSKKESYIKCVGKGLSMGMATINLNKLKGYYFKCFNKENHQFAICAKSKLAVDIKEIKL